MIVSIVYIAYGQGFKCRLGVEKGMKFFGTFYWNVERGQGRCEVSNGLDLDEEVTRNAVIAL